MTPLTVSELTSAIKHHVESMFPKILCQGEVSNFKAQTSGHLYFSLKDEGAQISAVMFRSAAASLQTLPKGGDLVLVKGELNVYPPKGNYQLIVHELSFVGIGLLLQKLEQLKVKLHQMGWFKTSRKKAIPKFPKRIGVVTSPTGAVIQDILNVLTRRFFGFHLILNPVKVQGEGAAEEIAQAIEQFNRYQLVDVMIVGRGGGSLEDLWPFNEERVASAIFHSQIPIISAVGHETDHCIADYVADVRAPTPSAAAEIVIAEKKHQIETLLAFQTRLGQVLKHRIAENRARLTGLLKQPLFVQRTKLIHLWMQQVDDLREDIDQTVQRLIKFKKECLSAKEKEKNALKPLNQIRHLKATLLNFHKALLFSGERKLHQTRQKTEKITEVLRAIDPKNVLKKGYSILFAEKEPAIIHSIEEVMPKERLRVRLFDGEILVTVNEVIRHE